MHQFHILSSNRTYLMYTFTGENTLSFLLEHTDIHLYLGLYSQLIKTYPIYKMHKELENDTKKSDTLLDLSRVSCALFRATAPRIEIERRFRFDQQKNVEPKVQFLRNYKTWHLMIDETYTKERLNAWGFESIFKLKV